MTNTLKFKRPARRSLKMGVMAAAMIAGLAVTGCSAAGDAADPASTSIVDTSTATASPSAGSSDTATESSASATTTAQTIADTSAAARDFLATLSDDQRAQVLYASDDETKSTSWSNFPVTFVDRAGLNLNDLDEKQRSAAMAVLEALLDDDGYATVEGIIGGDEFLAANSSSNEDSLGQYYLAFFGDPSDTGAWTLQFGGHHLGINATLDGAEDSVTFAPTHLGSQPAEYTDAAGTTVAPLAGMYETAFAFYDSLTEEQEFALVDGDRVADMVCAPGDTCDFPTGTGLVGADLTGEQRQLLLDVIANWVGMADEETTASALADIEATLDETYVTWSGATVHDTSQGDGIYFRISGPDVFIEFANQRGSADADVDGYITAGWGHVHTIYRNPKDDYAGSVVQAAASGMGGGPGRR